MIRKYFEYSGKRVSDGKRISGQMFVMPDSTVLITDRFRYEFDKKDGAETISAVTTIYDLDAFIVWQDSIKREKKIKL